MFHPFHPDPDALAVLVVGVFVWFLVACLPSFCDVRQGF